MQRPKCNAANAEQGYNDKNTADKNRQQATNSHANAGVLLPFVLVFIELSIECSSSDVEYFRRFLTIARREFEGFLNGPSLDRVHGLPDQFAGAIRRVGIAESLHSAGDWLVRAPRITPMS